MVPTESPFRMRIIQRIGRWFRRRRLFARASGS